MSKTLGVTSPLHTKSRTASPYQSIATWTPPGTGLGSSKRGKTIQGQGEGEVTDGGGLWKRALAVTGVGVGTEGNYSPNQTGQTTQSLYNVVMKTTQAKRGADKATTSLNRSAKQYGTKEEMYLELQGLKKAVRLAGNERDNLKSRLRRTEEELNRRDKELEEVLSGDGGLSQQELVRSLGDKERTGQGQGSGSKTLILSMKRQIYTLQKTLREREHALSKLQEDSKTMDTREMQVR
ncbi:IQ domain-containing protein E [Oopsacas minuta]|uniref:IQ domain-containing protein E n=1 Tax=Oopsacas minuta TaxID=111878 RepID=A0AAV7JCZ5_9METZ|nr:IQ domain-containing protein E [Oopsacas minuta]